MKVYAVRTGLEPVTPCVTGMYSNLGGAYGTRTRDPMRDRHVF